MPRYWIGVASKDHVEIGKELGVCQLCHGKHAPLNRMKKDDYILYYSPKVTLKGNESYQRFSAAGKIVSEGNAYQVEMFEGFFPFRKDVAYQPNLRDVSIDEIRGNKEWEEKREYLRFGHFEISAQLFKYIYFKMKENHQKKIELLEHIDSIHTTVLGVERIKRNVSIDIDDVVVWCKQKIQQANTNIYRKGKNWYVEVDQVVFTINAHSYTIITAHPLV